MHRLWNKAVRFFSVIIDETQIRIRCGGAGRHLRRRSDARTSRGDGAECQGRHPDRQCQGRSRSIRSARARRRSPSPATRSSASARARRCDASRAPATKVIDAGQAAPSSRLERLAHPFHSRRPDLFAGSCAGTACPRSPLRSRMLKAQAPKTPAPHWVQVIGGWTPGQFKEKRLPTLDEINAATGDVPCYVMHIYDRAFLNKAAMRVLGFTKDTANPFGGVLERDGEGNPTGMVVLTTSIASLLGDLRPHSETAGRGADRLDPPFHARAEPARRHQRHRRRRRRPELSRQLPGDRQARGRQGADAARRLLPVRPAARQGARQLSQLGHPGEAGAGRRLLPHDGRRRIHGVGGARHAQFQQGRGDPADTAEQQLAEGIKLVVSNGWPFRLHANYDVTAQRIMRAVEAANRDVPVNKVRWSIDHWRGPDGANSRKNGQARRRGRDPEPHVARRRRLRRQVGQEGGRGRARRSGSFARWALPIYCGHRRQPRLEPQPVGRHPVAGHRQDRRRHQAQCRPQPGRPHRGAAHVFRRRRLGDHRGRQEGHARGRQMGRSRRAVGRLSRRCRRDRSPTSTRC